VPEEIPVDLLKTGGRLIPPGALPQPPRRAADPGPAVPPLPTPPPRGAAAQPTPPAQPAAQTAAPADHAHDAQICRLCGWPAEFDPVEPGPDEYADFVRCVVLGQPYAVTLPLFDGAVEVRLRDLTPQEEDAIYRRVLAEAVDQKVRTAVEAQDRMTDFRLAAAVERFAAGPRVAEFPPPAAADAEDYPARHAALQTACAGQTVYQAVRSFYVSQFLPVLGTMRARAVSPSFRKATASPGPSAGRPSRPA